MPGYLSNPEKENSSLPLIVNLDSDSCVPVAKVNVRQIRHFVSLASLDYEIKRI